MKKFGDDALEILSQHQALMKNGHFVLPGGVHSSTFLVKDAILAHQNAQERIATMLAKLWLSEVDHWPKAIVGPLRGGAIFSQHLASALMKETKTSPVFSLFTDRSPTNNHQELPRAFRRHLSGERVLLVDDVLTTGRTLESTAKAVRENEGKVLGAIVLCRRGDVTAKELDLPVLLALVELAEAVWQTDQQPCPLCESGVPINEDYGCGKIFLRARLASTR